MTNFNKQVSKLAAARSPAPPHQETSQQSQINIHKRLTQQFYLHKSFDLQSDAEFLPSIPSDPVAMAIQVQERMNGSLSSTPSQQMMVPPMHNRQDQMAFYGNVTQRPRNHGGQLLRQHLFGGKRNDYAQYRSGP